jgi:hypothetical protein
LRYTDVIGIVVLRAPSGPRIFIEGMTGDQECILASP